MSILREEIRFDSHGDECAGTLFLPESGPEGLPAVVLAHGFTATREDGLPPFAERFAEEGFAALTFDYRGFGDSGGRERQVLSINRELEDVESAIGFARSHDRVDPGRIALWGSSLGGGLTLEVAARHPAVSTAIAQVPFADGFSMLGLVAPHIAAVLTARGAKDMLAARLGRRRVMIPAAGPPGSVAAMTSEDALPGFEAITAPGSRHQNRVNAAVALEILRWRPGKRAPRITCPLLVQVAGRDLDTPPGAARLAAEAAPRGELKTYDCGHFGVYGPPWFDRVVADQVEFLGRTL